MSAEEYKLEASQQHDISAGSEADQEDFPLVRI